MPELQRLIEMFTCIVELSFIADSILGEIGEAIVRIVLSKEVYGSLALTRSRAGK